MDTTIREALEKAQRDAIINEAYAEAESKYPYRDTHHAHREIIDEKRDAYASALISERKRTSLSADTQGVVAIGDAMATELRLTVRMFGREGSISHLADAWDAAKSSTEPDTDMVEAGVANTLENAVKFLHRANTVAGEHGVPKDQIVSYASAMVHWGNEIRDRASTPNQTPANNTDYLDSIMKEVEEWGKCPTCDGEGYFGEESCEQCHFVGHILPELDDLRTRLTPLFRKDASVSLRRGEYGELFAWLVKGGEALAVADYGDGSKGAKHLHKPEESTSMNLVKTIDYGGIHAYPEDDQRERFTSSCERMKVQYILITPEP